jgi:hypothetical protein
MPRRRVPVIVAHPAMDKTRQFTAVIEREDDQFVALCPELDIASQGETVDRRVTIWSRPSSCSSRVLPPKRYNDACTMRCS